MSQMRFCYDDMIIDSTVVTYNSENSSMPVENMGNEILAKKYRTETGFIIKSGYNDVFQFYEGRTGSSTVVGFALSATTFTGAGLASAVQTAMRANGKFSGQTVSYSTDTERFTTTKSATATSMSLRFANLDMSICEIMGYRKVDHASATTFISSPTKGNQQWVELQKDNLSGSVFILDNHNFSSGTVLKLRAQSTSTYFYGLNQYGHGDGIFQEFTNLVLDGTDLRASGSNWVTSNTTDELTDIEINGNLFTKVINSGASVGWNYQALTATFTNLILTGKVTLKKGSTIGNNFRFVVNNLTTVNNIFFLDGDWDNFNSSPGVPTNGEILSYNWIDIETIEIYFKCDTLTALTDDLFIRCFASPNATADEYTYWSEVQLIDEAEITMFPFIDGTHSADTIDVEQTMPDKFIVRMKIDPKFSFDIGSHKYYLAWYIDGTHQLYLRYSTGGDIYSLYWNDGGTLYYLGSQQFDDGTTYTDINQKLDIIAFLNLVSGGQSDSMFIVIPQESGAIFTDNAWSGVPAVKSSTFTTMSQGWDGITGLQADSDIEYLRIYDWDGTKPTITSSDDVDTYLADKTRLLNLDYKHTTYMKYLSTSTTMGQFEQEITVNESPCVTILDEALQGNVIQMSWFDIKKEYSEIGRAFLSPVFYPANHPDNKIHWMKRLIQRRSKKTMAYSGATYFDKRDPVNQYTLIPDPLNEYRNPTVKTDMETFLDAVADYISFYVILDSDTSNTVYGFLPGNTTYNRLKNTPTIIIPSLLLQEQK